MGKLTDDKIKWTLDVNGKPAMKELNEVEQETRQLEDTNKKLRVEMQKLEAAGKKGTKEWKQMKNQFADNNKTITANKAKMASLRKEIGLDAMTMRQLRSEAKRLKNQLDNTTPGTAQYKKLRGELDAVNNRMGQLRTGAKKTNGIFGKLKSSFATILPAAGIGAIVAGIAKLYQFQRNLEKTRNKVRELTDATGEYLDQITAKVQATATSFNKEFEEVLIAANNFSRTMGVEIPESLDLIQKGFAAGADANGEFLDKLREYGPQFKAAGVSAEQAIQIMTQEVKQGIYSDKGSDTIKEGTIRLREMTKATREALEGIGISSAQLERDLRSGETTYFQAMQTVSQKLSEIEEQSSEVGIGIGAIFGGPGEDAGLQFIQSLKDMDDSMDNMLENMSEQQKLQLKNVKANEELQLSFNRLLGSADGTFKSMFIWMKQFTADYINGMINGVIGIINYFRKLYNESNILRGAIHGLGAVITTAIQVVLTPLKVMWKTFETVGKVVVAIVSRDFKNIKSIADKGGDEIKNVISNAGKKVGGAWNKAFEETANPSKILEPITLDEGNIDSIEKNFETAGKKAGKGFNKGTAEERKKLLEKLKELQHEWELSQMEANEKELQNIRDKYNKEIEDASGHQDIINELKLLKEQELNEKKLEHEEEFLQKKQEIQKEYGFWTDEDQLEKDLELLEERYENELLTYEEYLEAKKNIEIEYGQRTEGEEGMDSVDNTISSSFVTQEQYNQALAQLRSYKEREYITEKEYNDKLRKLNKSYWEGRKTLINKSTSTITQLSDDLTQTELNNLETKKNKGLITEKQYEEQKKQIMKKYADIRLAASIAEIVVNTAMAVSKALGELGPIAGPIMAAVVGALGATQLALAVSEHNKVKNLAKGKYDVVGEDDGRLYRNVSYVGQAESGIYKQPTIISEVGDEMVLNGAHVKNLKTNYPGLLNAIMATRVPQRAEGKYPEGITGNQTITVQQDNKQLIETLNMLGEKIENIEAHITYDELKDSTDTISVIESEQSM